MAKDSDDVETNVHAILNAIDETAASATIQAGALTAITAILGILAVEVCKLREAIEARR